MAQPNNTNLQEVLKSLKSPGSVKLSQQLKNAILTVRSNQIKSTAIVESAINLDNTIQAVITKQLISKFPFINSVIFNHNPQILGGLKISAGDILLDLSLRRALKNITNI